MSGKFVYSGYVLKQNSMQSTKDLILVGQHVYAFSDNIKIQDIRIKDISLLSKNGVSSPLFSTNLRRAKNYVTIIVFYVSIMSNHSMLLCNSRRNFYKS